MSRKRHVIKTAMQIDVLNKQTIFYDLWFSNNVEKIYLN